MIVDERNSLPSYIAHSRTKSNQTAQYPFLKHQNFQQSTQSSKLINASHNSYSSHKKSLANEYNNPYFPNNETNVANMSMPDQLHVSKSSMLSG